MGCQGLSQRARLGVGIDVQVGFGGQGLQNSGRGTVRVFVGVELDYVVRSPSEARREDVKGHDGYVWLHAGDVGPDEFLGIEG